MGKPQMGFNLFSPGSVFAILPSDPGTVQCDQPLGTAKMALTSLISAVHSLVHPQSPKLLMQSMSSFPSPLFFYLFFTKGGEVLEEGCYLSSQPPPANPLKEKPVNTFVPPPSPPQKKSNQKQTQLHFKPKIYQSSLTSSEQPVENLVVLLFFFPGKHEIENKADWYLSVEN